jgi:hypothetical protein
MNRTSDMFGGRPRKLFGRCTALGRFRRFCFVAVSDVKPVSTPHQVRGGLFRENAYARADAVANRIFIPVEIAMVNAQRRYGPIT